MDLKTRIHNRRKELKLTLEQVGNAVGVNKSTVLKWENGTLKFIRSDKIVPLTKILCCTPGYLLDCEEDDKV